MVPTAAAMAWVMRWRPGAKPSGALWMMRRRNKPWAPSAMSRWAAASPPDEWPSRLTQPASPPKAWMLRCTQRRAASRSSKPRLGGAVLQETKQPQPVADGYGHHALLGHQGCGVVKRQVAGAADVGAAVNPDDDGQPLAGL